MRKLILSLFTVMAVWLGSGCTPENNNVTFNKSLLTGYWVLETEHYRYDADGNGEYWDTKDDTKEGEGNKFNWTLDKEILTHKDIYETKASFQSYTVLELTASKLRYKDAFNKEFTFTKGK